MSEPINNPTQAPAPEPAPAKTFTQEEVDAMIGKRLEGRAGRRERTLGQSDWREGYSLRKADNRRSGERPVEA